jgi:hypothetical protein
MPLKLNVGVSRKVGLPDYGSLGATCNLEVELDGSLLHHDLDAFHAQVRDAYVAAHQAVNDELAHLQDSRPAPGSRDRMTVYTGAPPRDANPQHRPSPPSSARPATPKQVRAIQSMARRHPGDFDAFLRESYGVSGPEELTLSEASRLIDELKQAVANRTA